MLPEKLKNQKGSALVYILIAIALLGALTVSFMQPSSQQTTAQNSFKTLTEVASQVDAIRSTIQECVLAYPNGDSTIITEGPGATDRDARKNYPINPDSSHYLGSSDGPSGDRLVRNLRCPGKNPGAPNQKEHEPVFTAASGKFLPPAPELFEDWQYYNGRDGVFFWTQTDKTDAFLLSALEKLDEKYSECEMDVIDTSGSPGGPQNLDSEGSLKCPGGFVCFRVWMIMDDDTAVYNGDTSGDESDCT